jgi:hypothetical protein
MLINWIFSTFEGVFNVKKSGDHNSSIIPCPGMVNHFLSLARNAVGAARRILSRSGMKTFSPGVKYRSKCDEMGCDPGVWGQYSPDFEHIKHYN